MKIKDDTLLTRYFLQEVSEQEKLEVKNWLEENNENREQFIRERIYFDASLMADESQIKSTTQIFSLINFKRYIGVAASIAFAIISVYVYDLYNTNKLSNQLQAITTPLSSRTQITLPDGSHVWLNANSTIEYSTIFSQNEREVTLNGEAYFDVAKSDMPFVVRTDKYNVEVLGTSFNVNSYSDNFIVSLFTGKVKLLSNSSDEQPVVLTPGQTAELIGGKMEVTNYLSQNSVKWKEGLIVLNDQSFTDIIELLEQYYGVTIIIENEEVESLGYVGSLRIIDGVEHALNVLKQGQSFSYKIDQQNNQITIH